MLKTFPEPGQKVLATLIPSITGGETVEEEMTFHDRENWESPDLWYGSTAIASWRPL